MFPVQLSFVLNLLNVPTVWVPEFSFKRCATMPVAPAVSGMIKNFMFDICCMSVHRRLCFSFSASVCVTFLSAGTATLSVVLIFIQYLSCLPYLVCQCVPLGSITISHLHGHILCVCVCVCVCVCLRVPFVCHFVAWCFAFSVM